MLDLAWWGYFTSDKVTLDWLIGGYPNKDIFDSNFPKKMQVYQAFLGVRLLGYYTEDQNPSGIQHTHDKLRELTA